MRDIIENIEQRLSKYGEAIALNIQKRTSGLISQIDTMLRQFEKLLHAPEGVFLFRKIPSKTSLTDIVYRREASIGGNLCLEFALSDDAYISRPTFLLCNAIDVVVDLLEQDSYERGSQIFVFDYILKRECTPERVAELAFAKLYDKVRSVCAASLGINFNAITAVAEMAYEKDESCGEFVFYSGCVLPKLLASKCVLRISADEPVILCVENARYIRKLFAGAGSDGRNGLFFVREKKDGEYRCVGYAKNTGIAKQFVTVFIERGQWTLKLNGKKVFCVKGDRVLLPPTPLDEVQKKLEKALGQPCGDLVPVLERLSAQKHGTSLVLANFCKTGSCTGAWMDNLVRSKRAVKVKPVPLLDGINGLSVEARQLLDSISRIDGAIAVDYPTCAIHYINAILDGKAVPKAGRLDVGSRHNAVAAFIANLAQEHDEDGQQPVAAACIFSEDGLISVEDVCTYT